MKKLIAILFTFLFVTSIVNAQDNADLQKKVQMMNDEMSALMMSGDEESMWSYYSDDVISMPSYQPMMKGIDACKESSAQMMESGIEFISFKSVNEDIMVSGDFVIDIGTYEISMTIPEMGDQPWSDNGKYMTIWKMQNDGSMLVAAETWNTDNNPWEEMKQMGAPEGNKEMQQDKQLK